MGLLGRIFGRRSDNGTTRAARAWREAWEKAVAAPESAALARLETALRHQPHVSDDLEVEEEMLDALRQLVDLDLDRAGAALPVLETSHRVVGADRCHFSAPVSMPDDPGQPTGRLLLTSSRAVFAGGSRTPALPWHAARDVVRTGRDLLFIRAGVEDGYRFRCNSFADAVCGAAIARHLMRRRVNSQHPTPNSQ
jgi:hypothetical protein